jgi:two-component system sensor histidine kinase CreC
MRFTRVTLFFIAFIITFGFYELARNFIADVEPQTFAATEEVMVDVSNILAESLTKDMREGHLDKSAFRDVFESAHSRTFNAIIYDHFKKKVGIQTYITDSTGKVIFDSDAGRREGANYSKERDVALTLAGKYGARSSRDNLADSNSSILYVAAPIGDKAHPLGVLTVYKAQADVLPLLRKRRNMIYTACGLIGGGIMFLIAAVFLWLFHPIGKITEYARAIERGERPAKPRIGIGREVNTLARALDSMRDALEGRRYVERYLQTLTHEMKSPLAAIRGAAELLDEEMSISDRKRFIGNIKAETARSERLINRLLELSAIESRASLDSSDEIDFRTTVLRAIDQVRPLADLAGVVLRVNVQDHVISMRGDRYILRAAVTNLLENAIDFSPSQECVEINLTVSSEHVKLSIRDQGPGVPEYAKDKIFERFYSLRHHSAGRKGTGLGLTLVRETAELHGGTITLEPAEGGGSVACLVLPV